MTRDRKNNNRKRPKQLGKTYQARNDKLCTIIQKIAEGLAEFSTDSDTLGDAYEYLIGQGRPVRRRNTLATAPPVVSSVVP